MLKSIISTIDNTQPSEIDTDILLDLTAKDIQDDCPVCVPDGTGEFCPVCYDQLFLRP